MSYFSSCFSGLIPEIACRGGVVEASHEDLLVIGDGWDTTGSGNIDPDPGESDEHGTGVSGVAAAVVRVRSSQ